MRPHTAHLLGLEGLLPPLDGEHQIPRVDAPLGDGGELEEEGGHDSNSLARPSHRIGLEYSSDTNVAGSGS